MNTPAMTRRQALIASAAGLLSAGPPPSRLSLEGYIWQNLAARAKKPLPEMIDELFATAPYAGFQSIELNDCFFGPLLKDRVIELTRTHKLSMPSVYVGGGCTSVRLPMRPSRAPWKSALSARSSHASL
jgi:hypothetical protein